MNKRKHPDILLCPMVRKGKTIIYKIHNTRREHYFLEVTIREQEMTLEKLKHNDKN